MRSTKLSHKIFAVLCVIALCFAFTGNNNNITSMPVEAKTMSQLEKEIADAKKKKEEYNNKQSALGTDIKNEQAKQNAIQGEITESQNIVTALNEKIALLENNITTQKKLIDDKQAEINQGIDVFKKRLRAIYLAGNDSMASVLLSSSDFFEVMMNYEIAERVSAYDKQIIDNLVAANTELKKTKAQYDSDMANLSTSKQEVTSTLQNLNSLYNQSSNEILKKQTEINYYKKLSTAEQAKMDAAEKEVQRILAEQAAASGGVFTGTFRWPLPGFSWVSSPFGWRPDPWGSSKTYFHRGIDISGAYVYGKPIVAAGSGKVVIATYGHPSYGNYVAISHGSGYTTLYAHASKLAVKVGDYVGAGQTIAYVGSTGNSTGAHLHFELSLNGNLQNPLNYVRAS